MLASEVAAGDERGRGDMEPTGDISRRALLSHAPAPVELDVAFPDLPVGVRGTGDHLERPRDDRRILPGELLTLALGGPA
jgi:hypothetical protein